MKRIRRIMLLFGLLFALAPCLMLRNAGAQTKLVFAVPVVQGLSVGSLSNMIKEMAKVLSKKAGVDIQVKEMSYKKGEDEAIYLRLLKEFQGGTADFGLVQSPMQYLKFKKQSDAVMSPAFTVLLNNKKTSFSCLYVKKSAPYKSIADLKGKTYGGVHTMEARNIMFASGVNTPVKDFFGAVKYIDDTQITIPMDALLDGSIDVHVTLSYIGQMAINANKKYADGIREFGCVEYEHNWIFFYRKGTPPDIVNRITALMLNAHKDKDFAQFKFLLTAIKGRFAEFDAKDLKHTEEIVRNMNKYGWEKEEKDFVKKGKQKK